MKHITLLPRNNMLGVVYSENNSVFQVPVWHTLPEGLENENIFTNAEGFAAFVKKVCAQRAQNSSITLCLNGDFVPALMFSHSQMSAHDVKMMRKNEYESVFPDGMQTMYTDDFSLNAGQALPDGKYRSIIFSVKKVYADALLSAFKANGLTLSRIVPFSALFASSAQKLCMEKSAVLYTPGEYKAAVCINGNDCAFAVFKGENAVCVSTLNTVLTDIIAEVREKCQINEAKAKEMIINTGINDTVPTTKETDFIRHSLKQFFRDLASECLFAVRACVPKQAELNSMMLFGEYAAINGLQSGFSAVMQAQVETGENRFKQLCTQKGMDGTPVAAILSAPYYASDRPKVVNLLNHVKFAEKQNKQLKTFSVVFAIAAAVLMLILPVTEHFSETQVEALKQRLAQSDYVQAEKLKNRYDSLSGTYDALINAVDALPHATTDMYGIIAHLNELTDPFGAVQSVMISENEKCTVDVSFASYDDAIQWIHAVDENEIFSFYNSPSIMGSNGYAISCELSIDSEKAGAYADAQPQTQAETTTQVSMDEILSEYNIR